MKNTPVDYQTARKIIDGYGLPDFGKATIREVVAISTQLEQETKTEFIHMEMGVPGLKAAQVGVDAEIKALQDGVASIYPNINGTSDVKAEASRFIKAFIDIDIAPEGCVPVTGSMQGTYASFLVCGQCTPGKDTILFIDPGFPVQKQQITVMGYRYESFDVYEYRGEKLRDILEQYLSKGNIAAMIYSNPNNPAWFCLTEEELKIIGVTAISDKLYHQAYPGLTQRYGGGTFGTVYIHRVLYALSSGTSHSAQFALAAMFKAAADGTFDFISEVKEYGRRAERLKKIFTDYGFRIVYDHDLDEPIADGFYFTIAYPGMTGGELMEELIYYGVSAISLSTTGSNQEGLRACTSFIKPHQYALLEERLKLFKENHTA